jgi:predicted RNA-binding protein
MCESNVFFKKGDAEELVFKEVMRIVPEGGDEYTLVGLLGDSLKIKGRIKDINLMGHKIVFEEA